MPPKKPHLEIELKVLDIDHQGILRILSKHGIVPRVQDQEDFVVLPGPREVVRVRKMKDRSVLTYKHRIRQGRFKVAQETEFEVSDAEAAIRVITRLCAGMEYYRYKKHRRIFEMNGVKCDLIELPPLKPYLELEGPPEAIEKTILDLGLSKFATSSKGIPQLLVDAGVGPETLGPSDR